MFINYPINIDYLIMDLRIHIGDTESSRYSDSFLRTSMVNGIRMLQRKWDNRYYIFNESMVVENLPEGVVRQSDYESGNYNSLKVVVPNMYHYIKVGDTATTLPKNFVEYNIFRNPNHIFSDGVQYLHEDWHVIASEDEYIVVLASAIIFRKSLLSSSSPNFQTWEDGEFRYSNLGAERAMTTLLENDLKELEDVFKKRLAGAVKSVFRSIY